MKMTKKIIYVSFIIVIMTTIISNIKTTSYASSIEDMKNKGDAWIGEAEKRGKEQGTTLITDSELETIFLPIGRALVVIGDAVLIVVAGIMGIQYITASPDKKAKLKQQLIGLVVSIVVIHGAVLIWLAARNFMESFTKEPIASKTEIIVKI